MSPDGTRLTVGRPIDSPWERSWGTPVRRLPDEDDGLEPGMALCLSGGRYRAMLQDPLDADPAVTARLADISTRLDAMPEELRELLVNWGYVVADAGVRSYVDREADRGRLPYPDRPLSDASAHGA
jgi:hypothetical protein